MKKVPIKIENEYVEGAGVVCGAKNSSRTTTLRVEFVNWDGLSKYATFKDSKGQYSTLVVLTLDMEVEPNIYEIPIPTDAMKEEGMMMVTFTGYTVEEGTDPATLGALENTATAYFRVLPSDAEFDDGSINASAQMQLQAEIDMLKTNYQALSERVAEAAGYANDSHNSSVAAATSASNAATSEANALSYKNRSEAIYNSVEGGFVTCGSVYFEYLPSLEDCGIGYMYEIKDDFTTTSDFEDGEGIEHVAGTSVYKTVNNKWAVRVSDVATLQAEVEQLSDDVATNTSAISTLDSSVSSLSSGKVDKVDGKGLSEADYTTAEKTKLAGIASEANKTVVDTALNGSSGNPVANSTLTTALNNKANSLLVRTLTFAPTDWMDFSTGSCTNLGGIYLSSGSSEGVDVSYAGYTPIAIVGASVKNPSNNSPQKAIMNYCYISGTRACAAFSDCTVYDRGGSSTQSGQVAVAHNILTSCIIEVQVLYVKN